MCVSPRECDPRFGGGKPDIYGAPDSEDPEDGIARASDSYVS